MGYQRREGQYNIVDYTPDNDENTLYIRTDDYTDFEEIIAQTRKHFGTNNISDFLISSEYIHTRCVYYDLYDSGDYDNYIVIRRKEQ